MGWSLKRLALLLGAGTLAAAVLIVLVNNAVVSRRCAEAGAPKASAAIEAATIALAKGDFERADDLARTAIQDIGERYVDLAALDDTGLKLSLADVYRLQGNIQASAKIRVSMAQSRLASLQYLARCKAAI